MTQQDVELNRLGQLAVELGSELDEIDQRETAAGRNFLECDEYQRKMERFEGVTYALKSVCRELGELILEEL